MKAWSANEVAYLEERYGQISKAQLSAKLGRTERAVEAKAWLLGLTGPVTVWTDAQIAKLKAEYGHKSGKQLAWELGKTPNSLYNKWRRMR